MPNPQLPAEMLDNIVDFLHGTKLALRNCCLVSKSWIPRTRKHLFADIRFFCPARLRLWKKTFPDPSTSPAYYTKTLIIGCPHIITVADAETGGWITGFSRVVDFGIGGRGFTVTFVPFHGFSSVIKSLRVSFTVLSPPQIFNLILSFPLLEDLTVIADGRVMAINDDGSDGLSTAAAQLSSLPTFTGSLELPVRGGIKAIAPRLLSLPGGIRFRKLTLGWFDEENLSLIVGLVAECVNTLESLDITCYFHGEVRRTTRIDLSKATRLKDTVFRPRSPNVEWITTALQTITQNHRDLRRVLIRAHHKFDLVDAGANVKQAVGEQIYGQWLDLDGLLDQFLESRSIRLEVVCVVPKARDDTGDYIGYLLPEMSKRGAIDLVEIHTFV